MKMFTCLCEKNEKFSPKEKKLQSITGQSQSVNCLYICSQNKVLSAGDSRNVSVPSGTKTMDKGCKPTNSTVK